MGGWGVDTPMRLGRRLLRPGAVAGVVSESGSGVWQGWRLLIMVSAAGLAFVMLSQGGVLAAAIR